MICRPLCLVLYTPKRLENGVIGKFDTWPRGRRVKPGRILALWPKHVWAWRVTGVELGAAWRTSKGDFTGTSRITSELAMIAKESCDEPLLGLRRFNGNNLRDDK